MTSAYSAQERRDLEAALRRGEPLLCPVCRVELTRQDVARPPELSYVRHRVWVLCAQCRRTASLDVR